jgi:ribose 5-phosphate isomerase A
MEAQNQNQMKQAAAMYAVDTYVQDGMVVGLGTGSTAEFAVKRLAEHFNGGNLKNIRCVATSDQIAAMGRLFNLPVHDSNEFVQVDVTIDGADEIEPKSFTLLKGQGGALLREKLVAAVTRMEVIIADESKLVQQIGQNFPIPVEVTPFAWSQTSLRLQTLGASPLLRPSKNNPEKPFITDGNNFVLDCRFANLSDPERMANLIKSVIGVVEHGLFINMAHRVIIGSHDAVYEVTR